MRSWGGRADAPLLDSPHTPILPEPEMKRSRRIPLIACVIGLWLVPTAAFGLGDGDLFERQTLLLVVLITLPPGLASYSRSWGCPS